MTDNPFVKLVYTPAGSRDAVLAIAACRAGGVGILNAELSADPVSLFEQLEWLSQKAGGAYGLRLATLDESWLPQLLDFVARGLRWLILDGECLPGCGAVVARLRQEGVTVLAEIRHLSCPGVVLDETTVDGLVLKGNESGGFVGESSSFIMLQKWRNATALPLYLRGGLTPQVAAACQGVGIAGGVLDSQVLLLEESPFAPALASLLGNLSGTETVAVGDGEKGRYFRLLIRPGLSVAQEFYVVGDGQDQEILRDLVENKICWENSSNGFLPVGQDVCFAGPWRQRYGRMADVFKAFDLAVRDSLPQAVTSAALTENAPLAQSLGITFPLVQGPMSRVSDKAAFALAIASHGALPVLALALSRGEKLDALLQETAQAMGGKPWGVGLLGFAPQDLLDEQLLLAKNYGPKVAILAGGRPDQAVKFEAAGIHTLLHVPAAKLLPLFLQEGARRFIFEGRECGGHVGPLSALVLWSTTIDTLVAEITAGRVNGPELQVFFAGGIHDAVSSAMVQLLAAPLLAEGVQVGVVMGTGYLFTAEIVSTGAVVEAFQQKVLVCDQTVNLESGPGHASRCAYTPFARAFFQQRKELLGKGVPAAEVRTVLDDLIMGRLQLAAKGLLRAGAGQELVALDEGRQEMEGMYMLGQVATLRCVKTDIASLHREVTSDAQALLESRLVVSAAGPAAPAPADIAIVGIASLLPKAHLPREFWENILAKVDAVTEIPSHRWDWRLYFDENRQAEDKIYSKWGGFIDDLAFDPTSFGMPPKSITSVDPMQLMALEVARRALADAGYEHREFDREHASVILGASGGAGDVGMQYGLRAELPRFGGDLPKAVATRLPEWSEDTFAGILLNVMAGRIANRLNFGGLNYTTDAACASSLAAVYQGVNELIAGRSSLVIAGGVDTVQGPFGYLCFSKTQALSPRGRCRTFDNSADGIVISEGLAMVVLKRLADAERDGDKIYAVIKGVGGSSDGKAKGLTAPLPAGQLRAMRRAYAQAGFGPETVGLFEAHGTGTVAGDTAELQSTTSLVEEAGGSPHQAVIGSVKSLIGHTKATAGIAGLIKAALALHHRVLPPHYGVEQPNPVLQAAACPLYLIDEARPWLAEPDRPRRAAASAFGFGGTNFHAVLQEYQGEYRPWLRTAVCSRWPVELLLFQDVDRPALAAQLRHVHQELAKVAQLELRDLACSLAQRWRPGQESLAIVATDVQELGAKLEAGLRFLGGETPKLPPGIYHGGTPGENGKVAVLFSGQGSQYPEMLRELSVNFPVMAETLSAADLQLRERFFARFGAGQTLSQFIYPRGAYSAEEKAGAAKALTSTDVAQPALGAVEVALWALLRQLGLQPDMLGGHSYGEFVALFAAGVFDFATLMSLSEARGRFIVDAAKTAGSELGTMAAVQAGRTEVETAIQGIAGVLVANHNAPEQCIISGSTVGIKEAMEKLARADVPVTAIPVAAAFHSPYVAPAQAALAELIEQTAWRAGDVPVYSNTTGGSHAADPGQMKKVMTDHLVRPVEFVAEVEAMYRDGARIFLELGPKAVLARSVGRILGERPHTTIAIDDQGGGIAGFLKALGQLLCAGVDLQVTRLFEGRDCRAGDPANLEQMQRSQPIGKQTWLLNGSGVRRAHEPVRQIGIRLEEIGQERAGASVRALGCPEAQQRTPVTGAFAARINPKEEAQMRGPRMLPRVGDASVMADYFDTMRQFLETQERVMSQYLGGTPTTRRPVLRPLPELPSAPTHQAFMPEPVPMRAAAPALAVTPEPALPVQPVAAVAAADGGSGTIDRAKMASLLLTIIEEKTGYPPDMVGMDQNLEADLGIDSIKRVEIVGALLKALPAGYGQALGEDRGKLNTQPTLSGMLDLLQGLQVGGGPSSPFDYAEMGEMTAVPSHPFRHIIEAVAEAIEPSALRCLNAGHYLVTEDALGVAGILRTSLEERGCQVSLIAREMLQNEAQLQQWCATIATGTAPLAGIVHLAQLGSAWLPPDSPAPAWREQLQGNEKSLFILLHETGARLQEGACVLSASALGGRFGRDARQVTGLSLQGGSVGLLKSLREENPLLQVKAVDVDPEQQAPALAAVLLDELELVGGRQEVGYPQGQRTVFKTVPAEREKVGAEASSSGLVILATAGLRGITAELLRELAVPGNTLLLTGRSVMPGEEPAELQALGTAAELQQYFIAQVRSGRRQLTPAAIQEEVRAVLAAREMRANFEDFRKRGAAVDYYPVDVADDAAMHRLFADIREQYGAVHGIVHGAGVIEDKLLRDKASASWSRVVETKVAGLLQLQRHVQPPELQFFTVLSSVAGRYGNSGQTDYATANELMNRLCCQLYDYWHGQVKVKALCWGPWGPTTFGAGMVTGETEAKFADKGVSLVQAAEGRRLFAAELAVAAGREIEIVCGRGPWEEHEAELGYIECRTAPDDQGHPLLTGVEVANLPKGERTVAIDLDARHAYLYDHRIDGIPVLPAAAALEIMAEAVDKLWPGWKVVEVQDCRLLKGIDLPADTRRLTVVVKGATYGSSDGFEVSACLQSEAGGGAPRFHYKAVLRLEQRFAEGFHRQVATHGEKPLTTAKAYDEWLFHGPKFQVIEQIDGLSAGGALARVRTTRPHQWLQGEVPAGQAWLFDPAIVDAAAQMAWLWCRAFQDKSALPVGFDRVVRFAETLPERLVMDFERLATEDPQLIRANVYFADPGGKVLLLIEGLESVASADLNRLGGTASGTVPVSA